MPEPRALVIGSEGNIGTPLVRHLRTRGFQVLESDIRPAWRDDYFMADITQPLDLLPAFDWGPQLVFLLSAIVSRPTCEQAASLAIATNLAGVNNVLQLCRRVNAMLVFFSTSEVYGPECELMDEAITDPRPNNRYGLSKLLGEQLVEYEVRTNRLRAVTLRPFMMYDEEEEFGNHRSAMIKFASNLALGRPIEVHRGSARSWLHVSDAVRAIEAATGLTEYSVINVGHGEVVAIEAMAEMMRDELKASRALVRVTDLPHQMTLVKRPVLERQRKLLRIEPAVGLREGLTRVCQRTLERIAAGERPLD